MTWTLIAAIGSTAVLTAVVTALTTSKRMRKKVAYMLDALEDKELNFRFDERRIFGRHFNKTLNRLKNIFDKERQEIAAQEKFFGLILDLVKTVVAVIEQYGRVLLCSTLHHAYMAISQISLTITLTQKIIDIRYQFRILSPQDFHW